MAKYIREDDWIISLLKEIREEKIDEARDYKAKDLDYQIKYGKGKIKSSSECPWMEELANEYKESLEILNGRISALESEIKLLKATSEEPQKDPNIIALQDRLKPIKEMKSELQNVSREILNYYNRSWWRSPDYTCNRRVSYIIRFAPLVNKLTYKNIFPYFCPVYKPNRS